ncbi:MAG: hypothetical protein JOZ17_15475 [Acetobacteraceae bacterium]|nr:hypothetical protein [Acetobacteraceae bacterium]
MRHLLATITLATALASALSSTPAYAQVALLYRSGFWMTFGGFSADHRPLCAAAVQGPEGRVFAVKWFSPNTHLTIHISKDRWTVPRNVVMNIVLQMDHAPPVTMRAIGLGNNSVELVIDGNREGEAFLNLLARASVMTISFLEGNEGSWLARLDGSLGAVRSFVGCIRRIQAAQGTQPYSTQPLQPVEPAQPTQPFTGVVNPAQRGPTLERRT